MFFKRKLRCEEVGTGLAAACHSAIEKFAAMIPPLDLDDEKRILVEMELSALLYSCHRMGMRFQKGVDESKQMRILHAFDQAVESHLDSDFLEFAELRGKYWYELISSSWGEDTFGQKLGVRFYQFCSGNQNTPGEPLIVGDIFEAYPVQMLAVQAVEMVFKSYDKVFSRYGLK